MSSFVLLRGGWQQPMGSGADIHDWADQGLHHLHDLCTQASQVHDPPLWPNEGCVREDSRRTCQSNVYLYWNIIMMNAGIYWLMLELDHSVGKLLKPHFPNIEEGWGFY